MRAEYIANRARLDRVVQRGTGAVRADVVDVLRLQAGVAQRSPHRPRRALALRVRRGDVKGVCSAPAAEHLGVDPRAPRARLFERFEDADDRALAEDEAVAVAVEGARGARRLVVAPRERLHVGQAGNPQRRDVRFGAAGQDQLRLAAEQQLAAVDEGVDAARAGCQGSDRRAAQPELDRNLAGGHVAGHHRHEERRDAARTAIVEHMRLVGDRRHAAAAGVDHRGDALGVVLRQLQPGVGGGQPCGGHRELREARHPPRRPWPP